MGFRGSGEGALGVLPGRGARGSERDAVRFKSNSLLHSLSDKVVGELVTHPRISFTFVPIFIFDMNPHSLLRIRVS